MKFKRTSIGVGFSINGYTHCEYECPDEELENFKNSPIVYRTGGKCYYEEDGKEFSSYYFPPNAKLIKQTHISAEEIFGKKE